MAQEEEEEGHPFLRLMPSPSSRRFSMLESRAVDPVFPKNRFRILVIDGPNPVQMVLPNSSFSLYKSASKQKFCMMESRVADPVTVFLKESDPDV